MCVRESDSACMSRHTRWEGHGVTPLDMDSHKRRASSLVRNDMRTQNRAGGMLRNDSFAWHL